MQVDNAVAPVHVAAQPAAFTPSTFQLPRFWLKAAAALNALCMFDTDATFHLLMSALNVGLLLNTDSKLVTAEVLHSAMSPYVVVAVLGLVTHAVTAAPTLPFVMHMAHATEPTVHA